MFDRRRFLKYAGASCALWVPGLSPALAADDAAIKDWPNKPVKLVVPNVPGGGIDILGRLLQAELSKRWGQPVVLEYKPGAGTVIGTDAVARSAPDGYTLGMVVTSHVINPSLRRNMPFDTLTDLAGVTLTATSAILLSASSKLPVTNVGELIAYAKANPGKLTYATPGAGSAMHLAGEQLKITTGIQMLHVAYKGSGGAYVDVMDGRVDLLIDPMFATMPHLGGNKLKALAVMSAKRDAAAPHIPSIAETVPNFDVPSINGIVAPRATPPALLAKISADFKAVLGSDAFKRRLDELGLTPVASTPEQFDGFIRREVKKWEDVVRTANVSIE